MSNAQVLDPALEVSLVDWTLEVAAGPVKARWIYLNAAAGGTLRPHQRRTRAYARWAGLDVNGGVKLGHGAAQNWATLGLRGTRVMSGGQSAALSM